MDIRTTTTGPSTLQHGVVYRKNKGSYDVHSAGRVITCTLSTRFWKAFAGQRGAQKGGKHEALDPIAVGDAVHWVEVQDGAGSIVELLPRQSKFSRQSARPMPGAHAFEQVIVANVDQIIPVFSAANPAPRWNMLDRYLVTAEALELPAVICITKTDLAGNGSQAEMDEVEQELAVYRKIGYPVVEVSAISGEGMDALTGLLRGQISVLVGKSGVGKTTLLNTLQPGLGLRVAEVSQATGKGRHTTTSLEMFPLDIGGAIVDTPGVREFGLWDVDEEDLAYCFPEMRPYLGQCRFGLDCQHDEEPGCAVRKAVVAGQIAPRRYQSYMRMKTGD